jgi:hypothetical protein
MPRTIHTPDLPPQHHPLSTVPDQTTQRPIALPLKGCRRTRFSIRSASLAIPVGYSWGPALARLVATTIALIFAVALSSMPTAYAENPPSAKPCDNKMFVENNRKYCAKSERPNYVGPARGAARGIPAPVQFQPGGTRYHGPAV